MNRIILDTSTEYLYVSIIKNDTEVFTESLYGKNNHSEKLMGIIENGLGDMSAKELDEVIVGIGPGSYTGVRVALTVAKVLAWTINKPLKTISSLTLVASGYLKKDGVYAISSIAKKGHVYGKIIEVENGKINILLNDIFLNNDDFNSEVEKIKLEKNNILIVNNENYKFDNSVIEQNSVVVSNIHEVVPNYLRKANS